MDTIDEKTKKRLMDKINDAPPLLRVFKYLAYPFFPVFVRLNISPNQVTLLRILFCFIPGILFMIHMVYANSFISGVVSTFLFLTMFVLDSLDGMIAVATDKKSKVGRMMEYLDEIELSPFGLTGLVQVFACFKFGQEKIGILLFFMNALLVIIVRNSQIFQRRLVEEGFVKESDTYWNVRTRVNRMQQFLTDLLLNANAYIFLTTNIMYPYMKTNYNINAFLFYFIYTCFFYGSQASFYLVKNYKTARKIDLENQIGIDWRQKIDK